MRLLPRPRTVLAWGLWAATTIGLVLTLRRPANPIGWLYAASALTWSLIIPSTRGWTSWSGTSARFPCSPSWSPWPS